MENTNINTDFVKLRALFIKRMTEDSETRDRRRKDFNQAIFGFRDNGTTYACFDDMDMSMVLKCFDDSVKDYGRVFENENKHDN